jgi:hypothetical protein
MPAYDEDEETPLQTLSARLMSRKGVQRRGMSDGGEVFTGPIVKQALRSIGARAFTMDQSIFVDESFDESNPEDLALYAHERHHQMESGGQDEGHGDHGAEETAARAIERMVVHRASAGEDAGSIMRDVNAGATPQTQEDADKAVAQAFEKNDNDTNSPEGVYRALVSQGKSHEDIVRELAQHVVRTMQEQDEERSFRTSSSPFFG